MEEGGKYPAKMILGCLDIYSITPTVMPVYCVCQAILFKEMMKKKNTLMMTERDQSPLFMRVMVCCLLRLYEYNVRIFV